MRLAYILLLIALFLIGTSSGATATFHTSAPLKNGPSGAIVYLEPTQMAQAQGSTNFPPGTLLANPASPQLGNPAGDVTVVEFFDYHCPYCKVVAPDVMRLIDEDSKVKLVMKEYPILGEDSITGAKAALAANKQGKYRPMHEALMAFKGQFTPEALRLVANRAGVDLDRLMTDMAAPDVMEEISRNLDQGSVLGINGTPGFIFGGVLVPGAISYSEMKKLVENARAGGD